MIAFPSKKFEKNVTSETYIVVSIQLIRRSFHPAKRVQMGSHFL